MQMKAFLLVLVVGAVAVLAKKGSSSSSEEDRNVPVLAYPNVDSQSMFVVSGPIGKRKPNRYPQGRPFQMDGQTSFYAQRPGMQQGFGGGQRPYGQNSFSTYPNYPTMGGSSRPFYAGSGRPNGRPNFYGRPNQGRPGNSDFSANGQFGGRPNQFPGNSDFSANGQFSGRPNQFPGNSDFSANGQFAGRPNQFPGNSDFSTYPGGPGNSQLSANAQYPGGPFPGNSQVSAGAQYPGNTPFPGNGQFSANTQYPGGSPFSASTSVPSNDQPSFAAQFPGSTFPGYNVYQVWPHTKPGRGPKPLKFKGPKHHHQFVVGRPQYPPQQPQPPYYHPYPQYPVEQGITQMEVQQFLEGIQKEMQDFSARAYKEFQGIENEIDRNRKRLEDTMKSQFQTLELALEAKQAKEIQQAVKEGKDELKIQECMAEEEGEFRADMDADIQRTTDCVNDATERARKVVNDARNAYTESSMMSSIQARQWAQKVRICAEQGNKRCVEEGMTLIREKTKATVDEGSMYFLKLQEAPEQQSIQMDYCRENFMDDLKDMRDAYAKMVKRCVIASEISQPEEEDQEKAKPEINVEVKPETEIEVKPEVEVQA